MPYQTNPETVFIYVECECVLQAANLGTGLSSGSLREHLGRKAEGESRAVSFICQGVKVSDALIWG